MFKGYRNFSASSRVSLADVGKPMLFVVSWHRLARSIAVFEEEFNEPSF
jgi:hypothetical protein